MIDHLSLPCSDLRLSGIFYDGIFSTLGFARVWSTEKGMGYGVAGGEDTFALKHRPALELPSTGLHVAFQAASQEMVIEFYQTAIALGGSDNGPPGLRAAYGPGYYAAFVIDPDGHHLEAVYHLE